MNGSLGRYLGVPGSHGEVLREGVGKTSYATSMPMERAVPATCATAPSMSMALRSGSLVVAISRTAAMVMVPAFSLRGLLEPFSNPAAAKMRRGVGGVLVMNVN